MNNQEQMQQSARLLMDAFSNGTHVWNDSADAQVKVQEEETFRKLPKAPKQIMSPPTAPTQVISWADLKGAAELR